MSEWQKGSRSGNGGCFQVIRDLTGNVVIRNSERPDEWISDTNHAFRVLVDGIKAGEFDHLLDELPRYVVQNRGAAWAIHDNEGHADVSVQVLEPTAQAMCHLLNESLR